MDTLFHRLLDRAVSATIRVSSPLIASIPITHSPAIPRAVVREGTWPCGSRFRHGVLRFLETKSMAGDSMEKKKKKEGGGFLEPGGWQVHFTAIAEAYFLTES